MSTLTADVFSDPFLREARVLKTLVSSPISDSWLVQIDGIRAVLRRDKAIAGDLNLDREAEWALMCRAYKAGYAPEPLWRDHNRRLLLKRYIYGAVWNPNSAQAPGKLRALGHRLQQLHSSDLAAPKIDIEAKIAVYMKRIRSRKAKKLEMEARSLARSLDPGADAVICHNDLGFANVVGNNPPVFLDWEYAGLGSRWFDVAGVCCQNDLSLAQIRELLAGYSGLPAKSFETQLRLACRLYDLMALLWYLSVYNGPISRPRERLMLRRVIDRVNSKKFLPPRGMSEL